MREYLMINIIFADAFRSIAEMFQDMKSCKILGGMYI